MPLLFLAGCGDLPRPFEGNPGSTALRLSRPPPARLAVPAPAEAMLSDQASASFGGALADQLVDQGLPAIAGPAKPGDWKLAVTAKVDATNVVVPSFAIMTPQGENRGAVQGNPMPAQMWANGDPTALKQEAAYAAPLITQLLASIRAQIEMSDPNSLVNRPARLVVPDVTGAPGDGNTSLAQRMREELPKLGEVVQPTANGADFTVAGQVHSQPGKAGNVVVDIQWVITDDAGHDCGRVAQINEVPAGTLDHYWADVALAVAQSGAPGIRQVVETCYGVKKKPATPSGTTPSGTTPSAAAPSGATPAAATPSAATPSGGAAAPPAS